ncbi:hypothetical protein Ahy_A06g026267 [Arachis hypogaea]|uniref:Uncharacterized protein n=1 Tax=Arachis hypogaea TaxID=3818 RepID=A0A445CJY3_ARAHY|nr:hypothetical protein Ahy_A06g026267 [Arachis hypogaea]
MSAKCGNIKYLLQGKGGGFKWGRSGGGRGGGSSGDGGGGGGGGWGWGGGGGGWWKWGCNGRVRGRRHYHKHKKGNKNNKEDYKIGKYAECTARTRCKGMRLDCPLHCSGSCFYDCHHMCKPHY